MTRERTQSINSQRITRRRIRFGLVLVQEESACMISTIKYVQEKFVKILQGIRTLLSIYLLVSHVETSGQHSLSRQEIHHRNIRLTVSPNNK